MKHLTARIKGTRCGLPKSQEGSLHSHPGTVPALPETALPFLRLPQWRSLPVLHQNSLKFSFNSVRGRTNEGHTSPERLAGDGCSSAVTFDKEEKSAPQARGTAKPWLAVNLLWAGLAREGTARGTLLSLPPARTGHAIAAACLSLLPTGSEQSKGYWMVLGGPATTSCLPSSQPMDPGPPVLPPCWAGTRVNTSFLSGLKKLQPFCAQPLLKWACPTRRRGPKQPRPWHCLPYFCAWL